jgi:lipid-binding SYLF domain-containing protein
MFRTVARFLTLSLLAMLVAAAPAQADKYDKTIRLFQDAGESADFFKRSYAYAVFPTIGKAGIGIGGAHGEGRVYVGGKPTGKAKMTQLSIGWQLGAQGYSLIVFLKDRRAFEEFTSGSFEFGAQASAVAITAGAQASAGTSGGTASAGSDKRDTSTEGGYYKGMAPFVIIKGGLMYEATIGGAKFSYRPYRR